MLIRHANMEDIPAWVELAKDVGLIFRAPQMAEDPEFFDYMEGKIQKYEAFIAVDRMTRDCLGIIGFSKTHNRITWFWVFQGFRNRGAGAKLLKCALNQLDWSKEITVETFPDDYAPGAAAKHLYRKFGFEDRDTSLFDKLGNSISKMVRPSISLKKAGSFHHNYAKFMHDSKEEYCPVCNGIPGPDGFAEIDMKHSILGISMEAQGRLFGKCHLLSKIHSTHFYDLSPSDMTNFMLDVQSAAKVLHEVTGAVKINYEIHGNTVAHLHAHLFPRYIDDDFPGSSISYNLVEPSPYESRKEFNWLVEKLREKLQELSLEGQILPGK